MIRLDEEGSLSVSDLYALHGVPGGVAQAAPAHWWAQASWSRADTESSTESSHTDWVRFLVACKCHIERDINTP